MPLLGLPLIAPTSLEEDNIAYEYEDDKELDENDPEVDHNPRCSSRPRLQTARISPAALDILSGALELLTPVTPPSKPKPALPRTRISTETLLLFSIDPVAPPPDVRQCDTPNVSDSLQDLISDKIYHLFGNRRFRNYDNFGETSKDTQFVRDGEPCPTIGEFANIRKYNHGKALPPTKLVRSKSARLQLLLVFEFGSNVAPTDLSCKTTRKNIRRGLLPLCIV